MSILQAIRSSITSVTTPLSHGRGVGGEAFILTILLASCSSEAELSPAAEEQEPSGHIVLTLGGDDLYLESETRAGQALTDISGYVFTISGKTAENETVTNQAISFTRIGNTNTFEGIFEAGTYALTADNFADAATGTTGKPYYSASSNDFSVDIASTTNVTIDLGTPKNAAVTYMLDDTFTERYNNPTIVITDADGNTYTLTAPATTTTDFTNAIYCHVASTPATQSVYSSSTSSTFNYVISASARANSHVTDIVDTTGSITVTSGKHTILTLSANPVTGEIIPIVSGEHSGEFN